MNTGVARIDSRTCRTAFTLIEVLVVIAILALLIAIVLPALRGARAHGRLVRCGANLREIGMGLGLYADEARDTLPLNSGETWRTAWSGTQGLEIVDGYEDTWISAVQRSLGRDTAPWLAPLRCPEAAFCPPQAESIRDVHGQPGSAWILNSYCRGRQRTSIPAPADGVMVMESACWKYMAMDTGSLELPTRPECYPHLSIAGPRVLLRWDWPYQGHKRNILWCDGHVATFAAAHWPNGDGTFDDARRRHMRFNLPGLHPLDP